LIETFSPIDLLFYGFAIYEGYRFSFKRVTYAELVKLVQALPPYEQPRPGTPNFSHIFAGIVVCGLLVTGLSVRYFWQQARGDYFEAIAHNDRGTELFEQGELRGATEEYQAAIRLYPDLAMAHNNLGWTYYYLDEEDKAIEAFQTAIRLDPNQANSYDGLGWSYYHLDKLDEAVEAFQAAIRLDANLASAYTGLGFAYMGQAEFEQAIEQFETLIELQPDWGAPHAFLAFAYYQLDQLDLMARARYRKHWHYRPTLTTCIETWPLCIARKRNSSWLCR
jgi:tetratricopeptide (TPR) repeat protein